MPPLRNRVGERFGRLTVVGPHARRENGGQMRTYWRCRCDCGNYVEVFVGSLTEGLTQSCGCYRDEVSGARFKDWNERRSTGHCREPLYGTWTSMVSRCHSENDQAYCYYGARGISVCARWRESFEAFRDDMGPRPSGRTLDRVNNDGDYTRENCRWATTQEQHRNRRGLCLLTFQGKTQTITEWAAEVGIPRVTLYGRRRRGWSVERTLTEPPRRYRVRD